jgi:hypothetical protein
MQEGVREGGGVAGTRSTGQRKVGIWREGGNPSSIGSLRLDILMEVERGVDRMKGATPHCLLKEAAVTPLHHPPVTPIRPWTTGVSPLRRRMRGDTPIHPRTGVTPLRRRMKGDTPLRLQMRGDTPLRLQMTGDTPLRLQMRGDTPLRLQMTGVTPLHLEGRRGTSKGMRMGDTAAGESIRGGGVMPRGGMESTGGRVR